LRGKPATEKKHLFLLYWPTFRQKRIERALRGVCHVSHHVRVNHRRLHILVTQQLLNFPDIDSTHQQMRRETVAEGMHRRMLGNTGTPYGISNSFLNHIGTDMMATDFVGARIDGEIVGRKNVT
jgi:hypothetical protein